jgi:AbrB family looped-hinge helix DNA binding protein
MQYTSTITSKGTITLPADIRAKLNLKQGERVSISEDSGQITIKPSLSWEELHKMNQAILKRNGNWPTKAYKSGDGFRAHVEKKYGKKSIN